MRNRNFAIEYLNSTVNKKITKTDFCKSKSISRNSLNMGLNSVGIEVVRKTKTNGNKREQSGTRENKSEQLGTKEMKNKIKNWDGAESKTRPSTSNLPDISLNQSELTRDTYLVRVNPHKSSSNSRK
jgi:hypothetical protein